jgi:hypothetical protein
MRVFIIDTSNMAPELHGGLIGVEGSPNPTAAEKQECIETVSQYVMDGLGDRRRPTHADRLARRTHGGNSVRALRQPHPARSRRAQAAAGSRQRRWLVAR